MRNQTVDERIFWVQFVSHALLHLNRFSSILSFSCLSYMSHEAHNANTKGDLAFCCQNSRHDLMILAKVNLSYLHICDFSKYPNWLFSICSHQLDKSPQSFWMFCSIFLYRCCFVNRIFIFFILLHFCSLLYSLLCGPATLAFCLSPSLFVYLWIFLCYFALCCLSPVSFGMALSSNITFNDFRLFQMEESTFSSSNSCTAETI